MLMGYVIKTYSQAPVEKYGCFGCYIEAYQRGVQALLVSTVGQCQSLRVWDEWQDRHPRSFLYLCAKEKQTKTINNIRTGVFADN